MLEERKFGKGIEMNIGMNLVQQSSFSVILLNYIFFHNIYIEHASIDGHLGCFQAVAIVNSAALCCSALHLDKHLNNRIQRKYKGLKITACAVGANYEKGTKRPKTHITPPRQTT